MSRTSQSALAWSVFTTVLIAGANAQDRPTARLEFTRDAGAHRCPEATELEDAVAARLGYVPFVEEGGVAIDVRVSSSRSGLRAVVDVADEAGRPVGHRVIASPTRDCDELARALALAVSVAIDPMVLLASDPPPPAAPLPTTEPIAPAAPTVVLETPTEAEPESSIAPSPAPPDLVEPASVVRVGVSVGVAHGAVPRVRPFVELVAERPFARFFDARLSLRWDAPAEESTRMGAVRAQRIDGRLFGCFGAPVFVACPGFAFGGILGRGSEVGQPRKDATWTAAAVMDVATRLPLGRRLVLDLRAGIDVAIRLVSLSLYGADVWTTPRVSPHAGVGATWRIP